MTVELIAAGAALVVWDSVRRYVAYLNKRSDSLRSDKDDFRRILEAMESHNLRLKEVEKQVSELSLWRNYTVNG